MKFQPRFQIFGTYGVYKTRTLCISLNQMKAWICCPFYYLCTGRKITRSLGGRLCIGLTVCVLLLIFTLPNISRDVGKIIQRSDTSPTHKVKNTLYHRQRKNHHISHTNPPGHRQEQTKSLKVFEDKIFPSTREEFAKLYKDDRIFFADGFSQNIEDIPSDNTDLSVLNKFKGNKLNHDELEKVLTDVIINDDVFRSSNNMQLLIYASKWIKTQKGIDTSALKSELIIHRKVLEWADTAHEYGSLFQLSKTEKDTLMNVVPGKSNYTALKRGKSREALSPQTTKDWKGFLATANENQMYEEDEDNLWRTLLGLATSHVTKFFIPKSSKGKSTDKPGEYPKLSLANGMEAWFTPMRYSRMHEKRPENYWMDDFERHTGIIAAFHLDRILGFRRAFLSVGRLFDIMGELRKASSQADKFFVSLIGNHCLVGHCDYRCTRAGFYTCGNPDHLEAAITLRTPTSMLQKIRVSVPYPWRRSDILGVRKRWEWDNDYCHVIKRQEPYHTGRRLLDIIDLAIFDFLQGNMARQTYDVIKRYGNDSFIVHNNNRYGFGSSYRDEFTILAPLYQCCMVRFSTLQNLLRLDMGPLYLSDYMRQSLYRDPLNPILLEPNLLALDRRLRIILKTVHECVELKGEKNVVIYDGL